MASDDVILVEQIKKALAELGRTLGAFLKERLVDVNTRLETIEKRIAKIEKRES